MTRYVKKRKEEIGMAPDQLFYRGKNKEKKVEISLISYDAENIDEKVISKVDELKPYVKSKSVTWININGLQNTELLKEVASTFGLSNIVMPELLDTNARARILEYEHCDLISIKTLQQTETDWINANTISVIMTENVLITLQDESDNLFDPVKERLRINKKRIRNSSPDYLLYSLLDIVIDNYLVNLTSLGDSIDDVENKLLTDPDESVIDKINYYKRELNFLRKNIKPAKEMIFKLNKMDSDFLRPKNKVYFNGLHDNITHAVDLSDNFRETLSDQLNIYHTTVSTKLNDIMKFLTIFSVIFIPLTFIAGIYGTNFDYIPELKNKYSYFIMWFVMAAIAVVMLVYFKKKKWL